MKRIAVFLIVWMALVGASTANANRNNPHIQHLPCGSHLRDPNPHYVVDPCQRPRDDFGIATAESQ